ncbi:hypothetical protein F5148DRAFT_1145812 [Russula earlei]|uniref:Uncharacterized protein n=1 Tax=Russula earlei TaxID=71964 RepID=A0ACC0UMB7_9AGAM|nr:hypothetical protein F5148DRAFT_1145812 [Russula earlei]
MTMTTTATRDGMAQAATCPYPCRFVNGNAQATPRCLRLSCSLAMRTPEHDEGLLEQAHAERKYAVKREQERREKELERAICDEVEQLECEKSDGAAVWSRSGTRGHLVIDVMALLQSRLDDILTF